MTTAYSRFIDAALSFQGKPYIWGGKASLIFQNGKLVKHKFVDENNDPLLVFDCSGLVTVALHMATIGKIDLRGTHSAKTILDTFPQCADSKDGSFPEGTIICYPQHVAIDLGRGIVVDANRGDSKTVSILDAQRQGARVEVHRSIRPVSSIIGYRRIPLDKSELKVV